MSWRPRSVAIFFTDLLRVGEPLEQAYSADTDLVEGGALLAATHYESSQRIVIGPTRALLLACLGVQGAEPDEQLHIGKPCVPALPLAQCDPTAELGDRFVDTPFERENGG